MYKSYKEIKLNSTIMFAACHCFSSSPTLKEAVMLLSSVSVSVCYRYRDTFSSFIPFNFFVSGVFLGDSVDNLCELFSPSAFFSRFMEVCIADRQALTTRFVAWVNVFPVVPFGVHGLKTSSKIYGLTAGAGCID